MTKPGNSDPQEPGKAARTEEAEPATAVEQTTEATPALDTEPSAKADPAEETAEEAEPVAEPANAESVAEAAPAAEGSGESVKPAAKARRARPVDTEPLMSDLEKAPPTPRTEALRAQAKRRFEEPPPRTLRFSFYFFVGAGLIWVVNAIQYLVFKQDIIDAQADIAPELRATPDQINNSIWAMIVLSVTFTAFLGIFGYKATEGTRRARTLVTIFSTMLVIFHVLLNGAPLGLLSALLGLTGLALIWSRSSRSYFPPRQVP
ncbi:hypothetical protein [Actinophytocola sp.]|uniref:hypothetical protein n=1 Tax=Actinophytocola sp. TaxID=1872138 RepID=UPI002ED44B96